MARRTNLQIVHDEVKTFMDAFFGELLKEDEDMESFIEVDKDNDVVSAMFPLYYTVQGVSIEFHTFTKLRTITACITTFFDNMKVNLEALELINELNCATTFSIKTKLYDEYLSCELHYPYEKFDEIVDRLFFIMKVIVDNDLFSKFDRIIEEIKENSPNVTA